MCQCLNNPTEPGHSFCFTQAVIQDYVREICWELSLQHYTWTDVNCSCALCAVNFNFHSVNSPSILDQNIARQHTLTQLQIYCISVAEWRGHLILVQKYQPDHLFVAGYTGYTYHVVERTVSTIFTGLDWPRNM